MRFGKCTLLETRSNRCPSVSSRCNFMAPITNRRYCAFCSLLGNYHRLVQTSGWVASCGECACSSSRACAGSPHTSTTVLFSRKVNRFDMIKHWNTSSPEELIWAPSYIGIFWRETTIWTERPRIVPLAILAEEQNRAPPAIPADLKRVLIHMTDKHDREG